MFVIHANLDAEARWAGGSLPGAIATRVSYYAALLSVLAPPGADVEVWAPAPIDASRLIASPVWKPPSMRVGTPPHADLVWANSDAKAANDRRLAHAMVPLAGSRVVATIDDAIATTSALGRWVTKAPWTTAGRDRCHGEGAPTEEQRTRLSRLIAKFGALVVEPWMDRLFDVGLCARVDELRPSKHEADPFYVTLGDAHSLITDARGTFLGIDLAPPPLSSEESTQLGVTAREVGARLAAIGFRGPFAIDAFAYRDTDGERRLHSLCEINARFTFGHVARAFAVQRKTRLGFGQPSSEATVLVAAANDGITAWLG